jgi:hypothetical protein
MKQLSKVIGAILIGIITIAAGLLYGADLVSAASAPRPDFTAPRQIIGYLNINAAKLPPTQVKQALWGLERLWDQTQKKYERQLNSKKMQIKLAKYRFSDLAQFRNIQDPDVLKLLTDILADSMRLTHSNHHYSLKINYAVVNSKITRYAPKPVAAYFRIITRNQNVSTTNALKITPNELAKRISETENFLKNNSGFARKEVVATIYRTSLTVYLRGATQTPAFTANKVNNQFLKSYQATANKYKDQPFGQLITEYLNILKQNQYQKTTQVEEFIKAKTA